MVAAWFLESVCNFATNSLSNTNDFRFSSRDVHYTINDFHLYENHIEQAKQYLRNVNENKSNIIDEKVSIHIQSEAYFDFDIFLKYSDMTEYKNFIMNKFYVDVYNHIKAEVAV